MVENDIFTLQSGDCRIVQVDVWEAAAEASLSRMLGCALPAVTCRALAAAGFRIIRIAPRRFWIIGDAREISLGPELGAVVSLDQGRIMWKLSGKGVPDLLSQLMAIDWSEQPPGAAVLTAIHRVPVMVLPQSEHDAEIIVPRSFDTSLRGMIGALSP
jgi:sarcosine oxidase subunit gamma